MYLLKCLLLISLCATGVLAQNVPTDSQVPRSKSVSKWVPFDTLVTPVSLWRDDGKREHPCEIIDWNVLHDPHPVLKIMVPPSGTFSPIRVAFRLSWVEDRPDYWMGINGVAKHQCKLRVRNRVIEVRLQVYE